MYNIETIAYHTNNGFLLCGRSIKHSLFETCMIYHFRKTRSKMLNYNIAITQNKLSYTAAGSIKMSNGYVLLHYFVYVRKLFVQTNQKRRERPKSLLRGCMSKVRFGDNLVNFACKSKYLNGGVGTIIYLKFTQNVYIILCRY